MMKKKLIFAGLLAVTGIANAQWGGSTTTSGDIFRTGNVRVGGSSIPINQTMQVGDGPASLLHNSSSYGMLIRYDAATTDRALLELHSPDGANRLVIQSLSAAAYITSFEGKPLVLQANANGRLGVGANSPVYKLDVETFNNSNDGMRMRNTGSSPSSLLLSKGGLSGGKDWGFHSMSSGLFKLNNATDNIDAMTIGTNGYIGVGTTPSDGKLDVVFNATPLAITQFGIKSRISQNAPSAGASQNYIAIDANASSNYAGIDYMYGVKGLAAGSAQNTGAIFEGYGNGMYANFGVVGKASGHPSAGSDWAGFFVGDVYRSGTDNFTSDRKLKNNIEPMANALEKILKLKPSTYTFKREEYKEMNLPRGKQMGLIAQDLEQVLPELVTDVKAFVKTDEKGNIVNITPEFKSVQYISLIPLLIGGMQDQQALIEKLSDANASQQQQLSEQKALIDQLLQKTTLTTGIDANNPSANGFSMSQNEPNPFSHETVIKYNLPQQTGAAKLMVYDLTGKQITSFDLEQKSNASITLTSEKLQAGIYIYSIVADGKIMDSKRMVVAEK